MEQLKKSMFEIARLVGGLVEGKLGERSKLEEQARAALEGLLGRTTGRVKLRFKRLENFTGAVPAYQTEGAAGLDVCACLDQPLTLAPGQRELVPTGLALAVPVGFEVQVRPRSGLAIKKGLGLVNSPGTIDADYRGEVKIIVINHGQEPITLAPGERVAQLVVTPVVRAEIEVVDDLDRTARGAGGFGSTGV